jgi:hypothetical protein
MLLTPAEILALTGGLTQPRRQLEELHRRGFVRAELKRGQVILTRAHFEAVEAGTYAREPKPSHTERPKLAPIRSAA